MDWQRRSTIKSFHLTTAVMAAIAGGLVWWNPGEKSGTEQADGTEFVSLSDRHSNGRSSEETEPDEDSTIEISASRKAAKPRVTPLDSVKNSSHVSADAPESETSETAITRRIAVGESDKAGGLRIRLLMAASERALRSENPWSELSMVALAFKKIGDEGAARYWFGRASNLAMDPDDSAKASRATREVVQNMLAGGLFNLATDLVGRIPLDSEKFRAKAGLVATLAKRQKFAEASRLADTISDPESKTLALQSLAEAQARHLDLDLALQTLGTIPGAGDRNLTLGRLAAIRTGLGDHDGALQAIHRITDPTLRNAAAARADSSLVNEGTVSKEAMVMRDLREGDLDEALRRAREIRLDGQRFRALQAVAVAMVRNEGVKVARKVVNLITDPALKEATYGKVAQQAALAGNTEGAAETIRFIGNPDERAMAYAGVALTSARYGADSRAIHLVRDASRELTRVGSPRQQAATRGILAQVFAETGDAGSALRTAADLPDGGLRDSTYRKLALSFAKSDDPGLAQESARKIGSEESREQALDSVALTFAGRVAATDAMRYLRHIDGSRQQVRFLLRVASRKG